MIKLNLGCGNLKITDYINVDINPKCKPDIIADIIKPLPFKDNSVDEVLLFHTIEHIQKSLRPVLLRNIYKVLKLHGILLISYPEFTKCYDNWKNNYLGKKDFWEMTIYGRQSSPSDFHVTIMHTEDFIKELVYNGFEILFTIPEPKENYNTVISARKVENFTYEDSVARL
ncbi:MAG: class I SAM-dependent methyltransferase [Bacteroidales bacterium]